MSAEFRIVGQPRPQLEGPAKVSGQATYTHDLSVPGMLHGVILRSPHPHARIRAIDLEEARAMPKCKLKLPLYRGQPPYITHLMTLTPSHPLD